MRHARSWVVLLVLSFGFADLRAAPLAPASALPLLQPASGADLAGTLRNILLAALPPTLYEASPGWGKTTKVVTGITWKGAAIHGHLTSKTAERNNGVWRKIQVSTNNLRDALVVDVRDVQKPEPGRTTFSVYIMFDARVNYIRQKWASGVRLSDNSARARLRVRLRLDCESTVKLQPNGWFLPDAVFRLRVLRSDFHYDNVVVEHIAGFGGTTARVIGDLILASVKKWHPGLERKFLDKANAAIVKAGDTKEMRIGLGHLR